MTSRTRPIRSRKRLSMREAELNHAASKADSRLDFSRTGTPREEDQPAVSEHRQRVTGNHRAWGRALSFETTPVYRWADK